MNHETIIIAGLVIAFVLSAIETLRSHRQSLLGCAGLIGFGALLLERVW